MRVEKGLRRSGRGQSRNAEWVCVGVGGVRVGGERDVV